MDRGLQETEFTEKLSLSIWKRLIKYLKPYKWRVWALIAANLGIAIGEIVFPLLIKYAIDGFVQNNTTDGLLLYGLGTLGVVLFQVGCTYLFEMCIRDRPQA